MRRDTSLFMRDFIESQIAAKRAILEEIERKKLTVQAELRTYEEMLAHLEAAPIPNARPNGIYSAKPSERGASAIPSEMTAGWRKILTKVDELGRSFGAADIVTAAEEVGQPLNERGRPFNPKSIAAMLAS
jgi:hypothetical protein